MTVQNNKTNKRIYVFSSVCMYIFCQHTSSLQEYLSVHRSPKNARQHVVQLLQLVHLVCSQPPATSCWELQQLPSSDSTHFCFFVLYVFCNSCLFCCYCFRAVLRATIAFRWFWFHYFFTHAALGWRDAGRHRVEWHNWQLSASERSTTVALDCVEYEYSSRRINTNKTNENTLGHFSINYV